MHFSSSICSPVDCLNPWIPNSLAYFGVNPLGLPGAFEAWNARLPETHWIECKETLAMRLSSECYHHYYHHTWVQTGEVSGREREREKEEAKISTLNERSWGMVSVVENLVKSRQISNSIGSELAALGSAWVVSISREKFKCMFWYTHEMDWVCIGLVLEMQVDSYRKLGWIRKENFHGLSDTMATKTSTTKPSDWLTTDKSCWQWRSSGFEETFWLSSGFPKLGFSLLSS